MAILQRQKDAQKRWYAKNKKKVMARVSENTKGYRVRNKEYVRTLKEQTPCKDCGNFYKHYQMDFDHIEEKKFNISQMIKESRSIDSIQKEMNKCELVCANCHRERTWNRLKGN